MVVAGEATRASAATPSAPMSPVASARFVYDWTLEGMNPNGSTATVDFAVGAPATFTAVPSLPGLSAHTLVTCGFRRDQMLVLPTRVVVQSTAARPERSVTVDLWLAGGTPTEAGDATGGARYGPPLATRDGGATLVRAVTGTGKAVHCDGFAAGGDGAKVAITLNRLAAGARSTRYAYIVLTRYFTPATPIGNPAMLAALFLSPNNFLPLSHGSPSDSVDPKSLFVTAASGPGLFVKVDQTSDAPTPPVFPNAWRLSPLGSHAQPLDNYQPAT
jgi:hypothetical protein